MNENDNGRVEHPHVGVGWKFPVHWDRGVVGRSYDEKHLREAMILTLRTGLGSRVMHPDFGAGVDGFVFAPHTEQLCLRIAADVRRALLLSEPRAILDRVEAFPTGEADDRVDVLIEFRLDSHRRPTSLVFPYYLGDRP